LSFFFTKNYTFYSIFTHIRISHVPDIWPVHGLIFKARGTCGSGERNFKIFASSSEVSQIFPHYTLISTDREVISSFFTNCGEPCFDSSWGSFYFIL
jgi:hypothetical protein